MVIMYTYGSSLENYSCSCLPKAKVKTEYAVFLF